MRSDRREYRGERCREKGHIAFSKQCSRAAFGILTVLGFGAFWYALIQGVGNCPWLFAVGLSLMLLGIGWALISVKR